jgi:hypothetical protein
LKHAPGREKELKLGYKMEEENLKIILLEWMKESILE